MTLINFSYIIYIFLRSTAKSIRIPDFPVMESHPHPLHPDLRRRAPEASPEAPFYMALNLKCCGGCSFWKKAHHGYVFLHRLLSLLLDPLKLSPRAFARCSLHLCICSSSCSCKFTIIRTSYGTSYNLKGLFTIVPL
ncbi:hypothetical protein PIB30_052577 [Stylosanthes scabra]|uniref:Uncharacterized protein n=1 Tax=Stylosanthes scabra TaxID=79078 RepID=A0ABU6ZH03_9FABA|nr:hypothetical protein [Stylosanthes scabra]